MQDTGLLEYFQQQHDWRVSILTRLGSFNSLPEATLSKLASAFRLHRVDQGAVLQAQGARPQQFIIITKGVCKVNERTCSW